jgi:phosphate transport system substrate-binding protein
MMNKIAKAALFAAVAATVAVPLSAQMRRNIRIVGSSTVYPFSKAVAERFSRTNPGVPAPIVESTGTGGGMKLFCGGVGAGHPDIANASRRIKASEFKACAANGVSLITEIAVGLDGVAVATGESSAQMALTTREIYMAVAKAPWGKPNPYKTWKDINARLPAAPIRVYGPPSTSGTRDSLVELLMKPGCDTNAAMPALKKSDEAKYNQICGGVREDGAFVPSGENDNLIVQKLAGNPGTVGIMGFSYVEENPGKLNPVAINGVKPTFATIASFQYPGARPLYIYVKNAHLKAIPGIRAYLAEFAREGTWGPSGYLRQLGMISLPDPVRARNVRFATSLTPMTGAGLK